MTKRPPILIWVLSHDRYQWETDHINGFYIVCDPRPPHIDKYAEAKHGDRWWQSGMHSVDGAVRTRLNRGRG